MTGIKCLHGNYEVKYLTLVSHFSPYCTNIFNWCQCYILATFT